MCSSDLLENVPRTLPKQCQVKLREDIDVPDLFKYIQDLGNISSEEMYRVFNMGIGFTLTVPKEHTAAITEQLTAMNYSAKVIGEVVKRPPDQPSVVFE